MAYVFVTWSPGGVNGTNGASGDSDSSDEDLRFTPVTGGDTSPASSPDTEALVRRLSFSEALRSAKHRQRESSRRSTNGRVKKAVQGGSGASGCRTHASWLCLSSRAGWPRCGTSIVVLGARGGVVATEDKAATERGTSWGTAGLGTLWLSAAAAPPSIVINEGCGSAPGHRAACPRYGRITQVHQPPTKRQ